MEPESTFIATQSWTGSCNVCNRVLPPLETITPGFFDENFVSCSNCGAKVDLWERVRAVARDGLNGLWGLQSLGAKNTFFTFSLAPGQTKEIDLANFNVPADAVILSVIYTPNGTGCFPVEIHGNDARRRDSSRKFQVFGRSFRESQGSIPIATSVCWTDQRGDPDAWVMLADALHAAATEQYSRVLVPAHSAFEIGLSHLLKDIFSRQASKDDVKRFMTDNLTASSALNVLLPYLCVSEKAPLLREEIRGQLNRLRRLRNEVVHEGLGESDLDKAEVRELLCAAVFGFEYVKHIRTKLEPRTQPNTPLQPAAEKRGG
jgi:hypothetical protein